MNTQVSTSKRKIINFLNFRNSFDYRFRKARELNSGEKSSSYWIATVDLKLVSIAENKPIPLLVLVVGQDFLSENRYLSRDVDGESGSAVVEMYNVPTDIFNELVRAKKENFLYYNLFIEEIISANGEQRAYILKEPQVHSMQTGIPANIPWFEEKVINLYPYMIYNQEKLEGLDRVQILYKKPYNWMK